MLTSDADVLFATTTVGASDAVATLQFNHALHRININLKGTIPDDLTIEVKSLANGQISLKDGNATANPIASLFFHRKPRHSVAVKD